MPRKAREKSSTGIYHAMLRGINGQTIFEDREDYEQLIHTIIEYKEVSGYEVYAYCLMSNHIHLLIKEGEEDLGLVFKRIGASYVYWYNWKYKRKGHLFQDRYKSEPVEDERYFLTVLRYIHQNPIKAGINKNVTDYDWSSYREYLGKSGICDISFGLNLFSDDNKKSIRLFREFNAEVNDDNCIEYEDIFRLDDLDAKEIIREIVNKENIKELQKFEKNHRNSILKQLKSRGLSIRQIERLTGISFGVIRKA